MNELRLKAYYQYDGKHNLPNDEVIRNLKLIPNDFSHALDEFATIEVIHADYEHKEIELLIRANCTLDELKDIAKNLLIQSNLYGTIL